MIVRPLLSLVLLSVALPASADEFRAFWVDAWGAGFQNQAQVEQLLGRVGDPNIRGRIRDANCNAVIVQVRRRADVCYPSGMDEPYMSGLSPSNFNALQAMLDAAHDTTGGKQRVEVHCWVVAFKTARGQVYGQHSDTGAPDNYWPTLHADGTENADGAFDPGHPKCLKYLADACMDLVSRFDIDGLHYDYIRFEASTEGFNPTSVARYNARYGLSGTPASGNEQFKQWRRDQVTSLVRQVYARILATKPHVKHSGSFVTWNPSPVSSTRAAFMNTRPYYDVYSDWDAWLQEGIIDMAVPMTYYNYGGSLRDDWTRWMNFEKDRKANRHMIVGPGIYLNSLDNAIVELQQTRDASPAGNYAQGFSGYSYRIPYIDGTWTGLSPRLFSDVTPTPANIPVMPWKTNPTTGHVMGTVTLVLDGSWADHAQITVSGPVTRTQYVDGAGFYAFIDLPPGSYILNASKPGYPDASTSVEIALGEVTGNMYTRNLQIGGTPPPVISNVQAVNVTNVGASITWNTDQASSSRVEYGTTIPYGAITPLDPASVVSHAVGIGGLSPSTLYHYRVLSSNANGPATSADFTFTTDGPPLVSNVQAIAVSSNRGTITWNTTSPANSQVLYGSTPVYEQQSGAGGAFTSHAVVLTGLSGGVTYHYQVVSANAYGADQSADTTFTTLAPGAEIIIDNLDPGWSSSTGGWSPGINAAVPKIGTNYLFGSGVANTSELAATRIGRWTPDIPAFGIYDVYVYYQIGANRTTGAPYKVVHSGGSVTSIQNQNSTIPNQGGWFLVGADLPFDAGTGGYVQISNNTPDTQYVSADAARFVFKSADATPPTVPVVTDDGTHTSSRTSLHATWESIDGESGIGSYEYRIIQQGGAMIREWTDATLANEVTASGLSLPIGKTYVFEVRAENTAGMSAVGSSDGIVVFPFDVNGDSKVNRADFEYFYDCSSGPSIPYPAAGEADCGRFDVDGDADVDQDDFASFQVCMSGALTLNLACIQ